jgi:hypothetical protein
MEAPPTAGTSPDSPEIAAELDALFRCCHRRRPETLRTAMAIAFFCPTNTTSRLPRVTPKGGKRRRFLVSQHNSGAAEDSLRSAPRSHSIAIFAFFFRYFSRLHQTFCQLEKFYLDDRVFGRFGKLPTGYFRWWRCCGRSAPLGWTAVHPSRDFRAIRFPFISH